MTLTSPWKPRRVGAIVFGVLAIVLLPAVASAQVMYLLTSGSPPQIWEADLAQGRLLRTWTVPAYTTVGGTSLSVTADGHYLFWVDEGPVFGGDRWLRLLDVSTGGMFTLGTWNHWPRILSHPTEIRAVAATVNGLVVLTAVGTTTMPLGPCSENLVAASASLRRVLQFCGPGFSRVIDTDSGAVTGTLPPIGGFDNASLNEDGSEAFNVSTTVIPSDDRMTVRRFDVASGNELASHTFAGSGLFRTSYDPRGERVFVGELDAIRVLDGTTLAEIGRMPIPFSTSGPQLLFDPYRPRAYYVRTDPYNPGRSYFVEIDTDALTVVRDVYLGLFNFIVGMTLAPVPTAPGNLAAAVTGDRVQLTWDPGPLGPIVTHYEIEAGSAPGLADVARLRTGSPTPELTVDQAGPGTYYVRVRAANYAGPGAPSNEVQVTVSAPGTGTEHRKTAQFLR